MNDAHLEILSRFFDGETVDPRRLTEALAQPDAAHYLTECAVLRTLVRDDQAPPSESFYERNRRILAPGASSRSIWRWLIQPSLAATLVLAGAALGYEYGALRLPAPAPPAQIASAPISAPREAERRPAAGGGVTLPSPAAPAARPAPSGGRRRSAPTGAVPIPDTHRHFGQWRELPGVEEAR